MTMLMGASHRLGPVLVRFPDRKSELLRLCLKDPFFRSLSEDLFDAEECLARLLAHSEYADRPEVAEIRRIIAELEAEVCKYVGREVS